MFSFKESNGVKYMVIDEFEKTGIVTSAFSTRIGGISTGETATMNLGFKRKDDFKTVFKNYEIYCNTLGIDMKKIVLSDQVHGNCVLAVTSENCGNKLFRESEIKETDALVTNEKGICIVTHHADCMPVFFLDTIKKAIGVAHSGWKGTTKNIIAKTIEAMSSHYGSNPSDIMTAIGPSIGPCCFEIGDDVASEFDSRYHIKKEKTHIDLWAVAKDQLKDCGIKKIITADICTKCNNDIFFSYRGDNQKTGIMSAMLMLK